MNCINIIQFSQTQTKLQLLSISAEKIHKKMINFTDYIQLLINKSEMGISLSHKMYFTYYKTKRYTHIHTAHTDMLYVVKQIHRYIVRKCIYTYRYIVCRCIYTTRQKETHTQWYIVCKCIYMKTTPVCNRQSARKWKTLTHLYPHRAR